MPTTERIYIPFPRELYEDIVRFSDGRVDVGDLAEEQVAGFIEMTIETSGSDLWGARLEEVAEKYAPGTFARWQKEDETALVARAVNNMPLVWKEVTIEAHSKVRMSYDGTQHYATVMRGRIVDGDKEYSPSEWASKVAGGTSRNAWRDLSFQEPRSKIWVPAQILREQALELRKDPAFKPKPLFPQI